MNSYSRSKNKVIALAGQPNTGKSTVFNYLTGSHQHVGNWPGKTVEQKLGNYNHNGQEYSLVDLPGTYSLTSHSLEEKIARDFLINENPDAVVVMADASQLERSLYLLTEIQLLDVPVILALNMMDVAAEQGKIINIDKMQTRLGVKIIPMAAARGEGTDKLIEELERVMKTSSDTESGSVIPILYGDPIFNSIKEMINGKLENSSSEAWTTVKLIERDTEVCETVKKQVSEADWKALDTELCKIENGQLHTAGARYNWIAEVLAKTVDRKTELAQNSRGKRFDQAATHPFWGKIIAIGIMILGFAAAMIIAGPLMSIVRPATGIAAETVRSLFSEKLFWLGSLLADGLIPGVGVSLMMLSYIFGVYLVFALLEDIGYVARLAYVFDRSMNRMGLHGKSFMPLLMSFGCNIAGVTGTRVIDSWQQRMATLVMASIVPCLALWGVISFVGTIFFSTGMPLLILFLLITMLLHLSLTSFLLRKFIVKGEASGLIMELPPYHKPNWKTIFRYVWNQVKSFLMRACSLIAVLSVVVWALSFRADGNMELSLLASIGKFFDPVTRIIGLDWRLFIALLAAMIAKEASLSVIAVLFGLGGGALSITSFLLGETGVDHAALAGTMAQGVSPASALAFIFAFFFSIPCLGTVASIYSETKSLKWTIGTSLYYIFGSLIAGALAYRVGLLIF